jgi:hypothetical protein
MDLKSVGVRGHIRKAHPSSSTQIPIFQHVLSPMTTFNGSQMQDHGAPTRFWFTWSPYIAAFFAATVTHEGVIWAYEYLQNQKQMCGSGEGRQH